MYNKFNTKIILGTSKLGWNLHRNEINKFLSVINYAAINNIKLHVSCLYGNSIDILSKNLEKKNYSNYLLKIFFKDKISFFHQISYFIETLSIKEPFDIQIDEYSDYKNIKEINLCIKYLKTNNLIKNVYFTPIRFSSKLFTKFFLSNCNIALHFSLVEREFNNSFLIKNKKKIIALRAFGGSLNNFFFSDFNEFNSKCNLIRKNNLEKILLKYDLSEVEARAQYILKHRLIDYCIFSTRSLKKFKQLLFFEKKKFNKKVWNELELYSNNAGCSFKSKEKYNIDRKNFFFINNNYYKLMKSLNILNNNAKQKINVSMTYFIMFYFYYPLNLINKLKLFTVLYINKIK